MSQPTFSLAELAHYDRCLFPEDLMEELIEHGLPALDAIMVKNQIIDSENKIGIVELCHSWRKVTAVHAALIQSVVRFAEKYPNRT